MNHRFLLRFCRLSAPLVAGIVTGTSLMMPAVSVLAAPPSAEDALKLQPVQADISYQKPSTEEIVRCRVVDLREGDWTGWAVETAEGTKLRRYADTDGDKKVDLWCYYDQGIEVYRDIDADHNGKADQYRWLGTAGTRWGLDDNEDGKIDRWRQISAEEVTAEVVAALANKDVNRFTRLLANEKELDAIGLGTETQRRIVAKLDAADAAFAKLAKEQTALTAAARWVQFAAPAPGIVPQGTEKSTRDVRVYENAVAMYDDNSRGGQLLIGTLVQSGDAWRLVDVPQVVEEGQPMTQATGVFFTPGGNASAAMARTNMGAATQELVGSLEAIDRELASAKKPDQQALLNRKRVDVVEKLIATSADRVERDNWMRQLVDTVSIAVQNGSYPDGVERLKKFSSVLEDDPALQAYVNFQIISTEYVSQQTPDADFTKVQEWYLESLTKFVDQYPESPESAQALLQLGLSKEFEEKQSAALDYYTKVARTFADTDAGEKATGAIRRLQSEGRSIDFSGRSIKGESFDLAKLSGKPVIIHYWATWCDACKQDMKLLRQLQAKYQAAGLTIVGVNVDATRELANDYLKANPAPWVHLYEDGGLESSGLAKQLGVQTLPMMLLVDPSGKVVSNNVYAASLDAELAKIAKPAKK